MAATANTGNSGAMHQGDDSTSTPAPIQPTLYSPSGPNLMENIEMQQLTLETEENAVTPDHESGRKTMTVQTPSGSKLAILMTDGELTEGPVPFVPELHGHEEFCNVWSQPGFLPVPNTGNSTDGLIKPSFNDRILHMTELCQFVFSHVIIRLMCTPAMFQSQRLWISHCGYADDNAFKKTRINSLGFDWNPAECNEVYVVLPYGLNEHMVNVDDIQTSVVNMVGQLHIEPLMDLITEEGLSTQLEVTYMACPLNLRFFGHRSIDRSLPDPPPICPDPTEPMLEVHEINGITQLVNDPSTGAPLMVTEILEAVPAGMAMLTWTGIEVVDHVPFHDGIPKWEYNDNFNLSAKVEGIEEAVLTYQGRQGGYWTNSNTMTRVSNTAAHFHQPFNWSGGDMAITFESTALDGLCKVDIACRVVKAVATPTKSQTSKTPRKKTPISQFTSKYNRTEKARQEIQEYKGVDPTIQARKDLGITTGVKATRDSTHWRRIETKTISASTRSLNFKFSSLDDPALHIAGLFELIRNLYTSGLLTFKITSSSNPSSTSVWRIQQQELTFDGPVDSFMQKPGHEWNPNTGPHIFKEIWEGGESPVGNNALKASSVRRDIEFDIRMDRLSASHGTDYSMTLWLNTADLEYHHKTNRARQNQTPMFNVPPPVGRRLPENAHQQMGGSEDMSPNTTEASATTNMSGVEGILSSDREWQLAANFPVDIDRTQIIQFAVGISSMGEWNQWTAARYRKWKGNPQYRIRCNAPSTVDAQMAVVHLEDDVIDLDGLTDQQIQSIISAYPHALGSVQSGSVTIEPKWRQPVPTLYVQNDRRPNSDGQISNGKIAVIFYNTAFLNGNSSNTNQISFSLEANMSNIKFSSDNTVYATFKPSAINFEFGEKLQST